MLKDKLKYFFEKHSDDKVYSTSDEVLFINKQDATNHGNTLDNKQVKEHLRSGVEENPKAEKVVNLDEAGLQNKAQEVANKQQKEADKKLSPAELKVIKDKAIADYTELFNEAPDTKLSAVKIQELIEAKKLEQSNAND